MESASVAKFDLSSEGPNNYFKSSFARSMAFSNSSQSKSLDYVYLDESSTINEESEAKKPPHFEITTRKPRRSVPSLPTYDPAFPREYSASVRLKTRGNDALKFWKMKQEAAIRKPENSWPNGQESLLQEESKEEEILRLRKECQGLMETNRKLQAGNSSVDTSVLQTQIDTLQWQLKQAESNRQMYKAVMEQVSKFLERVQKALESSPTKGHPTRGKSRVPRSRSVHTVVTQSRASSPSPCQTVSVHRANSISQIQDSYCNFRDYAWRNSRAGADEVSPERLSQDAFRLLRTIQSLLGTREPDLARVTDGTQQRDSTSMGSCSSLLQSSICGVSREAEDSKSSGGPATPQLSVGSTEDESGFSSMSSFHDGTGESRGVGSSTAGTGTTNGGGGGGGGGGEGSHHELGLPLVTEQHRHRRWSSTPVDTGFRQPIRVLWTRESSGSEVPNSAYKMTNVTKAPSYSNYRYNKYVMKT